MTSKTKQHKETPWQWYNGCSWWRLGTVKGQGSPNTLVICPTIDHDGHPNLIVNQYDMNYIVHCVNSHDELVENFRLLMNAMENGYISYSCFSDKELLIVARAKQSLKKAGQP